MQPFRHRRSLHRLLDSFVVSIAICGVFTFSNTAQAEPSIKDSPAALLTSQAPSTISAASPSSATPNNGFMSSMVSSTSNMAGNVLNRAGDLVLGALNMIGMPYRWGGDSPDSGLDCSGFVRFVFQDTFGFLLPRRAAEMSRAGTQVAKDELRPGDLVFFNTMRRTFSHVGIYIGDNKFVHAPSRGNPVRVDDMSASYWSKRYNGARRIEVAGAQNDRARVDGMLRALQPGDGSL